MLISMVVVFYASQKSYIEMRQSVSLRDNHANQNGGGFYLEESSHHLRDYYMILNFFEIKYKRK